MSSPLSSSESSPSSSPILNPTLATIVAGAVAGAASRTLTAPLDRIKILVQEGRLVSTVNHRQLSTQKTMRLQDVGRMIYQDGGLRAFWRGNLVNCLKAGPEFAMVFSLRRVMLERIKSEQQQRPKSAWIHQVPQIVTNFAVGAFAGVGAQAVLYPLELVKTRVVVTTSNEYGGGIREIALEAWRAGGVQEFYRGFVPNLCGIFLFRGFEVGVYTTLQNRIVTRRVEVEGRNKKHAHLSVGETVCLGMVASVIAQTVTYPLNVVRTRLQAQGIAGREIRYKGMADCFVKLIQKGGVRSLFGGLVANYMKAVPASATAFVVFEEVQRRLGAD